MIKSILDLGSDVLLCIIKKTDPETLLNTSTLCKQWLDLSVKTQEIWEEASKNQFPSSVKKKYHSWREHYLSNIKVPLFRKMEFVDGLHITVFLICPFSFTVLPSSTSHGIPIHVCKSNKRKGHYFYRLITASDKTIKVWNKCGSALFRQLDTCVGHVNDVTAFEWVGKSNFISGGSKGEIIYWIEDRNKYKCHFAVENIHNSSITHLKTISFQHGNNKKHCVLSGAMDGTIGISRIDRGKFIRVKKIKAHKTAISAMEISQMDSQDYLFTASSTETCIKIWQLLKWKLTQIGIINDAHHDSVKMLRYYPVQETLLSFGNDRLIKMWQRNADNFWICNRTIPLQFNPQSLHNSFGHEHDIFPDEMESMNNATRAVIAYEKKSIIIACKLLLSRLVQACKNFKVLYVFLFRFLVHKRRSAFVILLGLT